jgi:hypothetical protein
MVAYEVGVWKASGWFLGFRGASVGHRLAAFGAHIMDNLNNHNLYFTSSTLSKNTIFLSTVSTSLEST